MKQWELKDNSEVELPDGKRVTFLRMDGMYAKWDVNGELATGNFDKFKRTDFGYKVVTE